MDVSPFVPAAESAEPKVVGRLVDCSQADDRRLIRLVRQRRLLYARSNMPVASYYAQVRGLWDEVAAEMGWTVPEVRRKWSHVRNSYSRHLRNELGGARTGRGRAVSRWHLADELDFLRDHMATDTRTLPSYSSLMSSYSDGEGSGASNGSLSGWGTQSGDVKPLVAAAWHSPAASPSPGVSSVLSVKVEPQPPPQPHGFAPDENDAYFQFFRAVFEDYRALSARRQRQYRRRCLELLHQLLDEQDAAPSPPSFPPHPDSDPDAILPND